MTSPMMAVAQDHVDAFVRDRAQPLGPPPMYWHEDEIAKAVTRAADDVLEAAGVTEGDPIRDAVNLLVNATMTYLGDDKATLRDAVAENYQGEGLTVAHLLAGLQ